MPGTYLPIYGGTILLGDGSLEVSSHKQPDKRIGVARTRRRRGSKFVIVGVGASMRIEQHAKSDSTSPNVTH
jgi:hypothetical protein